MRIVHIGKMRHIKKESIITQNIYKYCEGKHIYHSIYKKKVPKAEIYILHCFRNDYELFRDWEKPKGSKVISLIHSYEPCVPCKDSDVVVTITKAWQKHLKKKGIESVMIYPGIDLKPYENVKIDYSKKVIGRISRAERGKFHPEWNYLILDLLKRYKDVKYRLICNKYNRLPIVKHKRAKYIKGVKINQTKKKIKQLSKLSIYADAHGDFIETFSMGLLEAMACGLPCIIMTEGQKAMMEVLGYDYRIETSFRSFKKTLFSFLDSAYTREFYGDQMKQQAQFFSLDKFIDNWNKLLNEVVK